MNLKRSKAGIIIAIIFLITLIGGAFIKYKQNERVLGEADTNKSKVYGLVIPHHDLAEELIISAIESAKSKLAYERIVIIGPNHYYPDSYFITTTDSLGDYPVDGEFVGNLSASYDFVELDSETLMGEHSVGIPIRYLREAYPEAEFIPIIVSAHYREEYMNEISQLFSETLNDDTLYVLSMDFAHNVGFTEGMENNDESILTISSFDYETILSYDDKHIDSPLSAIIFLKIMQRLGADNWRAYDSSHGSVLMGIPDLQGTSYVTGAFSR